MSEFKKLERRSLILQICPNAKECTRSGCYHIIEHEPKYGCLGGCGDVEGIEPCINAMVSEWDE